MLDVSRPGILKSFVASFLEVWMNGTPDKTNCEDAKSETGMRGDDGYRGTGRRADQAGCRVGVSGVVHVRCGVWGRWNKWQVRRYKKVGICDQMKVCLFGFKELKCPTRDGTLES